VTREKKKMVMEMTVYIVEARTGDSHEVRLYIDENDSETIAHVLALCREFAGEGGFFATSVQTPPGEPRAP